MFQGDFAAKGLTTTPGYLKEKSQTKRPVMQARRHGGAFGGSAPLNFVCAPQILLRTEKFVSNI